MKILHDICTLTTQYLYSVMYHCEFLIVCILTRPTSWSKYGKTCKNINGIKSHLC